MVSDNILVTKLSLREATRGYLISLKASNYSPRYVEAMELALRLFTDYAEAKGWPQLSQLTASHIEDYLVYLRERPRWFGKHGCQRTPMSDSSVETNYRCLKTFFNWLVGRGHVARNPLDLVKHPKFEERVIPTVSEKEMPSLLELVDPRHARTEGELSVI